MQMKRCPFVYSCKSVSVWEEGVPNYSFSLRCECVKMVKKSRRTNKLSLVRPNQVNFTEL
jgi:hypothetical protein